MDLSFSKEEEAFRREVREWLEANLVGPFEKLRGRGGPGDEHSFVEERIEWTKRMGEAGWNCMSAPPEFGGQGLPFIMRIAAHEWFMHNFAFSSYPGLGEGAAHLFDRETGRRI